MWISICTVYFVVGHQDFVKRSNSASSSIRSTKNTPSSWAVVLGLPYNKSSLLLLKILIGRNVKSSVPKRYSLIFKVETALPNQTARRNALILAHRPKVVIKKLLTAGYCVTWTGRIVHTERSSVGCHIDTLWHIAAALKRYVATALTKPAFTLYFLKPEISHIYLKF